LGGVRLLTGPHAGEGWGKRVRERQRRAEVSLRVDAGSSDPVAAFNTQLGDMLKRRSWSGGSKLPIHPGPKLSS